MSEYYFMSFAYHTFDEEKGVQLKEIKSFVSYTNPFICLVTENDIFNDNGLYVTLINYKSINKKEYDEYKRCEKEIKNIWKLK